MNLIFNRDNIVLFMVLAMLVLLSLWMQFDLLDNPDQGGVVQAVNDPDYYVEYLSSFGVDINGKQYQLEADRLVHFPQDNKSLLDKPHITQYVEGRGPTHIYADSGWLFANGDEILMTDNVKVIRSQGQGLGGAATTDRMRIKLKPKK